MGGPCSQKGAACLRCALIQCMLQRNSLHGESYSPSLFPSANICLLKAAFVLSSVQFILLYERMKDVRDVRETEISLT